jgi:hypothetical protein
MLLILKTRKWFFSGTQFVKGSSLHMSEKKQKEDFPNPGIAVIEISFGTHARLHKHLQPGSTRCITQRCKAKFESGLS